MIYPITPAAAPYANENTVDGLSAPVHSENGVLVVFWMNVIIVLEIQWIQWLTFVVLAQRAIYKERCSGVWDNSKHCRTSE